MKHNTLERLADLFGLVIRKEPELAAYTFREALTGLEVLRFYFEDGTYSIHNKRGFYSGKLVDTGTAPIINKLKSVIKQTPSFKTMRTRKTSGIKRTTTNQELK